MFSKDYFVVKDTDKEDFKTALTNYKNWLEAYILENKGITLKKYIDDESKEYEPLKALFSKYSYLNSINSTEIVASNIEELISEYQKFSNPMSQSVAYFEFTDALITENIIEERSKEDHLKSFKESGLNLDKELQQKLNETKEKLSKASLKYSENIINSKKEWFYELTDNLKVELTDEEIKLFEDINGKKILKYNQNAMSDSLVKSKSSEFKRIIYEAMKYPASKKSNHDNTETTSEILSLKQNIAQTLGYSYYTDFALKDRMAGSYDNVSKFLEKIKIKMKPLAEQEYQELNKFIKDEYKLDSVEKWERGYYANLKKEKELNYTFNMERPYFPQQKVFEGVYSLINKLFGFTFVKDTETFILPYEDTECYKVYEGSKLKAYLLVDMYERPLKNAGAWVQNLSSVTNDEVGLIALCCTVNKKDIGLNVGEITTLLHEFGHAVHNLSSTVDFKDMAGTSGMARDAVEIPSQMLEQYAYNRDYLKSLSSHVKTGEVIGSDILDSIIKSKNYGIGGFYARQLVFALFDINVYHDFKGDISEYYKKVANDILPTTVDEDTNFTNVFSHIFSGGYSAGYYGYMWADIYSIDAYTYVLENELENANKFKIEFLAKGSSQDAKEIYENFRGKEVDENSFLTYYGLN